MKSFARYHDELASRKRRRKITRITLVCSTSFIVCGAAVYVLFFVGWFNVRAITVTSPEVISSAQIEQAANQWLDQTTWGIKRRRNSIIFSPRGMQPFLLSRFPRAGAVTAKRTSVHELAITVSDKKPVGVWCFTRQKICYYFDENGKAFSRLPQTSGFLFAAVNDQRNRTIQLGEEVAPAEWRNEIITARRIMQFGGLAVSEFSIASDSFDQFETKTTEGWSIIFSIQTDVAQQARNLLGFLKDKISTDDRKKLEYINLTIPDRIYYK